MENEAAPKKQLLIMRSRRRFNSVFVLLLLAFGSHANEKVDERWRQIQERVKYERSARPDQPSSNYIDPPYYSEGAVETPDPSNYEPDDDDIQESRAGRFPTSGNNGLKQRMQRSGLPEVNDVSTPDVKSPDYRSPANDRRDVDAPSLGGNFWKILFIIIAVALVALLIYQFVIKVKDEPDKPVIRSLDDHADWDPTEVEVDELTRLLNEALLKNNFRAGVRVYYTLILKEMVEKGWITWEKKKTNYHYALELGSKRERPAFERCVFLFELVWYGNYSITQDQFQEIEPTLKSTYNQLRNG